MTCGGVRLGVCCQTGLFGQSRKGQTEQRPHTSCFHLTREQACLSMEFGDEFCLSLGKARDLLPPYA